MFAFKRVRIVFVDNTDRDYLFVVIFHTLIRSLYASLILFPVLSIINHIFWTISTKYILICASVKPFLLDEISATACFSILFVLFVYRLHRRPVLIEFIELIVINLLLDDAFNFLYHSIYRILKRIVKILNPSLYIFNILVFRGFNQLVDYRMRRRLQRLIPQ
jgi:hypothetical protein